VVLSTGGVGSPVSARGRPDLTGAALSGDHTPLLGELPAGASPAT
jgi:hypothetical protein